jgi:transcriptional regulator with XRE-family HTH domain
MTQQDVAKKIGVTPQYYQYIETGQRLADLNTSMIGKFAEVFGVSASEIYRTESEYQAERAAALQAQGLR